MTKLKLIRAAHIDGKPHYEGETVEASDKLRKELIEMGVVRDPNAVDEPTDNEVEAAAVVAKANEDAEKILSTAKADAERIVAEATKLAEDSKAEADKAVADAKVEAKKLVDAAKAPK